MKRLKDTHSLVCWRGALKDGQPVELQLWVNETDLLNWLGGKALASAGGESKEASGAVVVKVVKPTHYSIK